MASRSKIMYPGSYTSLSRLGIQLPAPCRPAQFLRPNDIAIAPIESEPPSSMRSILHDDHALSPPFSGIAINQSPLPTLSSPVPKCIGKIDELRRNDIEAIVRVILHSDLGVNTFAQIVDKRPTRYASLYSVGKPGIAKLLPPSPQAKAWVRKYVDFYIVKHFPSDFEIDPVLASTWRRVSPGSKAYEKCLVGAVAQKIHDIAANLYYACHWVPGLPGSDDEFDDLPERVPFFYFPYICELGYPLGMFDIVGFWAEWRIFGGVVLFDHGIGSDVDIPCNQVYIHTYSNQISLVSSDQLLRFNILRRTDLSHFHIIDSLLPFSSGFVPQPTDANIASRVYRDAVARIPAREICMMIGYEERQRKENDMQPLHLRKREWWWDYLAAYPKNKWCVCDGAK